MLYTYSECLAKYKSKYAIRKLIEDGQLFKQEKGIYSDSRYVPAIQIITMKYPNAVFTLNSAYYYYNMTDDIPEHFYLATERGASKIADKRVIQIFENSDCLMMGAEKTDYEGTSILMYNRERLLVELLRNKNKLPFDYYKEILANYRKIIDDLDVPLIQDYAYALPKSRMIMETLQMEVM